LSLSGGSSMICDDELESGDDDSSVLDRASMM
jgi:hypothetical protein